MIPVHVIIMRCVKCATHKLQHYTMPSSRHRHHLRLHIQLQVLVLRRSARMMRILCATVQAGCKLQAPHLALSMHYVYLSSLGVRIRRDDECSYTVQHMFDQADVPERVFVGVCEQNWRPRESCQTGHLPLKLRDHVQVHICGNSRPGFCLAAWHAHGHGAGACILDLPALAECSQHSSLQQQSSQCCHMFRR